MLSDIGNWSSVIGLVISVFGFILTIRAARNAKTAAERAQEAALNAQHSIKRFDTAAELTSAIALMDDIKRMHRQGIWEKVPEKYAEVRKLLISIKGANHHLSDEFQRQIQAGIVNFATLESQIDEQLDTGTVDLAVAKLNRTVSKQIDTLQSVLVDLRTSIGGPTNDL